MNTPPVPKHIKLPKGKFTGLSLPAEYYVVNVNDLPADVRAKRDELIKAKKQEQAKSH